MVFAQYVRSIDSFKWILSKPLLILSVSLFVHHIKFYNWAHFVVLFNLTHIGPCFCGHSIDLRKVELLFTMASELDGFLVRPIFRRIFLSITKHVHTNGPMRVKDISGCQLRYGSLNLFLPLWPFGFVCVRSRHELKWYWKLCQA